MRWILLVLWVGANLGAAALACVGWLPLSDRLDGWLQFQELVVLVGFGGLFSLAGCGLALGFAAVLAALAARSARWLLYLFPLALPVVLFAGWIAVTLRFPQRPQVVRDAEFHALAERSRPLTDALARYVEDHDLAPPALEALVPRYLPAIPSTGLTAHPIYRYRVFAGGMPEGTMLWYGLGSCAEDWYDDWRYEGVGPLGDGILIVIIGADGRVVATDTDRVGSASARRPFDAGRWREDAGTREKMLLDLRPRLLGLTLEETRALLGPEDGLEEPERHAWDEPFELQVDCPQGLLNSDVFVYWPSEDYPDFIHEGWVERIDGWAFVRHAD
jgi:hypothetical protein